jgi:Ubiquitin-2 like Rad60 SUMO-like
MLKTQKMRNLFDTHARQLGVSPVSLRLLLDGDRIEPDQTINMLEIVDGDMIDCMFELTGGVALKRSTNGAN